MRGTGTILGIGVSLLASWGLQACGPGADGKEAPTGDTADPDLLDPFVATSDWSVEETIAHVDAGLALGLPDPRIPYGAYVELLSGRDETCPNAGDQLIDLEMPTGGCTSASGYHYAGNTVLVLYGPTSDAEDVRGFSLGGDFEIRNSEGQRLAGGGIMAYQWTQQQNGQTFWRGEAAGSWIYERHDGVFGSGIGATLGFSGITGTTGTTDDSISMDGTVGVGDISVQFVQVTWAQACGGNPTGSVRMRDPSGVWSTLDYEDRCDGCGTYTSDPLGEPTEACLDLSVYKATIEEMGVW